MFPLCCDSWKNLRLNYALYCLSQIVCHCCKYCQFCYGRFYFIILMQVNLEWYCYYIISNSHCEIHSESDCRSDFLVLSRSILCTHNRPPLRCLHLVKLSVSEWMLPDHQPEMEHLRRALNIEYHFCSSKHFRTVGICSRDRRTKWSWEHTVPFQSLDPVCGHTSASASHREDGN